MTMATETFELTGKRGFTVFSSGDFRWIDSVRYKRAESAPHDLFMSNVVYWVQPHHLQLRAVDTDLYSLMRLFVSRVSGVPEIERIFWKVKDNRVRVWIVIDEPDLSAENRIYDAELDFMDMFPELLFDFAVIFRQGKNPAGIFPEGATRVFSKA